MNLFDKARFWARHNSVRLAAVAGPIASVAVSYPRETLALIELLPTPVRAITTFAVITVLPILARVLPQPKLGASNGQ